MKILQTTVKYKLTTKYRKIVKIKIKWIMCNKSQVKFILRKPQYKTN